VLGKRQSQSDRHELIMLHLSLAERVSAGGRTLEGESYPL
jgi:hypothetical protein